jgi:uncharacterized protein
MRVTRVFFITDIHGSDLCFRKFLNSLRSAKDPDIIIIGGDITGKWLVPLVSVGSGTRVAQFEGSTTELCSESEVVAYEKRLADTGAYTLRCDRDTADRLLRSEEAAEAALEQARLERLRQWVDLADRVAERTGRRIVINGGNDDPFYVDPVLHSAKRVIMPEGRVVPIDDNIQMLSIGYANRTPWPCPRDIDEAELEQRVEKVVSQVRSPENCIFNFHAPPYGTTLDVVMGLDKDFRPSMSMGVDEVHAGSTAVRQAIERYQPLVSLHGHIHEHHAFQRIGRTVCFNPGSDYTRGLIQGVYLEFAGTRLVTFSLTREDLAG